MATIDCKTFIEERDLLGLFNYIPKKYENGHVNSAREKMLTEFVNEPNSKNVVIKSFKVLFPSVKSLEQKGGMINSYDFICYNKDGTTLKIELKVMGQRGNDSLPWSGPQFTDIWLKNIGSDFEKSFMTGWIEVLTKMKEELELKSDIPTFKQLVGTKGIYTTKPKESKVDIIKELYKVYDAGFRKEINRYHLDFHDTFIENYSLDKVKVLIQKQLDSKTDCKDCFINWDGSKFVKKECNDMNIKTINLKMGKSKKKIGWAITTECGLNFTVRLRWKNRNAIAGPCFKIGE